MRSVFQRAVRFRTLGFVIAMLSVTYRAVFEDNIGTAILLIISIICDMQYKCPFCHKIFDIRIRPDKIQFCPRCGEKIL